jgi:hypothetical protein
VEYVVVILLQFSRDFGRVTSCQNVQKQMLTLEVLALITVVPGHHLVLIKVIFFYGNMCG